MRFVVAGGGVAGLAAGIGLARAGHQAVVLERDEVAAGIGPEAAFELPRRGIPHYLQPHAFLPRGRLELLDLAPEAHDLLIEAGAEPQDLAASLHGEREPGDDELIYLWARRPLIEWALRRAASEQEGLELVSGARVAGLLVDDSGQRARGVALENDDPVVGEVVVDALGRYRPPAGWPRPETTPVNCGAVYYCRYYRLAEGVEHMQAPILNPRGDLGYMGFNTFRGDNRTYAVILLVNASDRELRVLHDQPAWERACSMIRPLDVMTSSEYGTPITGVMPMGNLMNTERTGEPAIAGLVAVGDAFCHTDPSLAYGLSFSIAHGAAVARAAVSNSPPDVGPAFREKMGSEARERYELVCGIDDGRARRWSGEAVDLSRRDGCYPLFSFAGALAAAPHDDEVLRRTVRRIGMLDRTASFDRDAALHARIEEILARALQDPPPPSGPPRSELLAAIAP